MIFHPAWRNFLRKGQEGWIKVTPENSDDIWALYNVIAPGDEVEAVTMRRVILENSSGANVDSTKVKVLLAVRAEKMDIDIKGASLRVNGKNVKENKHVKPLTQLGSYHTLDIEPDRDVKISKSCWDAVALEFLESAACSMSKVEIGVIQLQEGLGFICSLLPAGIKVLDRVEVAMPKKKFASTSSMEKTMEKFYNLLADMAVKSLNFAALKAVVIAASGSLKDDFYKFFINWLQKHDRKDILAHKNKFMRVNLSPSNTLNPHNIVEVLKEPRLAEMVADTKSANETKLLDEFHKILSHSSEGNDGRATYGLNHVLQAAEECAVKHLLLADGLFRSANVQERQMYGKLISTVKENGGKVLIFSPNTKADEGQTNNSWPLFQFSFVCPYRADEVDWSRSNPQFSN